MRFWKKKKTPEVVIQPRMSREQILESQKKLAEQVMNDLRAEQIGPQPDYPVKPNRDIPQESLMMRFGLPPVRYHIDGEGIKPVYPQANAMLDEAEREYLDDLKVFEELQRKHEES